MNNIFNSRSHKFGRQRIGGEDDEDEYGGGFGYYGGGQPGVFPQFQKYYFLINIFSPGASSYGVYGQTQYDNVEDDDEDGDDYDDDEESEEEDDDKE